MLRIGELGDAGRFVVDQLETYLDLAHAELSERRRETVRRLVWAAAACVCTLLGLWFGFLAIVIASWDTPYRMAVTIAIPAVLLLGALAGFLVAARGSAAHGWLRIRREIQRDLGTLREILWTR